MADAKQVAVTLTLIDDLEDLEIRKEKGVIGLRRHPEEKIVMIPDGAGWHKSKSLAIPDNVRLVFLPPYSPELNPMENLRESYGKNHFTIGYLKVNGRWKANWRFH